MIQMYNILNVKLLIKQSGWSYVMSWGYRVTGVMLVGYALLHITTMSLLSNAQAYDNKMVMFSGPIFVFFEIILSIPVIFHT
jgi:succinate dehydrogenase/fumarate reductase cytochrome b subunit